jgi:transposase
VLAVAYHLSKRQVKQLLRTLLGIDIALGTIVDVQNVVSEALASPVGEVQEALKQCEVAHQDESKWPEAGKSGYVWVTVSGPYAYYKISHSRGGEVARSLLGGVDFNGHVVTDRYVGYRCYPMERRGICHSHLERDFQKIVDRGEDVREIGEGLLALEDDIFTAWYAFNDNNIDRDGLQQRLLDIAVPYEKFLFQGMDSHDSKVAGMCENIYNHWEAIWNFGWVEGMEPTNNEAERSVRHLVVMRKKCYGTQSASGSLFVARMATVFETCRRQSLNVLEFVTEALRAHMHGTRPPSLVVANST